MASAATLARGRRSRLMARRLGAWLQPQISSGAREQRDQAVLLLAIAVVVAPHFQHLPVWSTVAIGVAWIWRSWLTQKLKPAPGRLVMFVLLLLGTAAVWLQYGTLFGRDASVNFLLILIGLKVLEMRAHRDVQVIVFLSLFVLQTQFLYDQGALSAVLMVVSVGMLFFVLISVNLPEGDISFSRKLRYLLRVFLLALPLTLTLFFLFPRLPSPIAHVSGGEQHAGTGLSDSMSPNSMRQLLRNDDVALRARFDHGVPPQHLLYWRGPVFTVFDGKTWWPGPFQQAGGQRRMAADLELDRDSAIDYTVTLEPTQQHELFALEMTDAIVDPAAPDVHLSPTLELQTALPISSRRRYRLHSFTSYRAQAQAAIDEARDARQLPDGFNPRTLSWAAELRGRIAGTQPPHDPAAVAALDRRLVAAVLRHFHEQAFHYNINAPALGSDSVDEFLFDTREGYCEHYASAFVVLMRAMGVPARVVTGYQGGEVNPVDGYLTVRQSDAHAWAEVWIPGQGWVREDPTAAVAPDRIDHTVRELNEAGLRAGNPGWSWLRQWRMDREAIENTWNQWFLSYSAERQRRLIAFLGLDPSIENITIVAIAVFCVLMAVMAVTSLRRRAVREPLAELVFQLRGKLARQDVHVPHEMGLHDMGSYLEPRLDPACMPEGRQLLADISAARYARPGAGRAGLRLRSLRARLRRWQPMRAET